MASSVPSVATHSDSSAYEDLELERDVPPPVPSSQGKSPVPDVAEQVSGSTHEVVDLSSGSDLNSKGSSSVPASKPPPYACRTKELEATARKAQAAPSK